MKYRIDENNRLHVSFNVTCKETNNSRIFLSFHDLTDEDMEKEASELLDLCFHNIASNVIHYLEEEPKIAGSIYTPQNIEVVEHDEIV